MISCPSCSKLSPDDSLFCSGCGASLGSIHDQETRTEEISRREGSSRQTSSRGTSSLLSEQQGQFIPGTVIAERYRIVGLLGKGGMGEVYRADDLKLGQPVALKFLPRSLAADESLMARFFSEVRIARQISHSNVCRVYDVAEIDGQPLLSMEYVDGENLAALLRRIGRLPEDKAVQVARQMCAGLAAAHQQGIIHRDLKPSNVMLDGQGRVRITDFGLAGVAGAIEDSDIRVGTPSYMAPEQLAGKDVSFKSDIYSLGLVLYELFTGRRAFETGSPGEVPWQRAASPPPSPSNFQKGLDPVVEQIILRSLEYDPARRPASVLAVAAALPGGDPLTAALEAGVTPSPEMVAEAGESGGLRPVVGTLLLLAFFSTLLGAVYLSGRVQLLFQADLGRDPASLAAEAERMVTQLGHAPPFDRVFGFDYDRDVVNMTFQVGQENIDWATVTRGFPSSVHFWYRQNTDYLVPFNYVGWVAYGDPPLLRDGMVSVRLDPRGRLLELLAVPPILEESAGQASQPDWDPVFALAGLDRSRFQPVEPRWNPPFDCDTRAAWQGTLEGQQDVTLRIEAGAYRGKTVFFRVVPPWRKPPGTRPDLNRSVRWALAIVGVLACLVISGAVLLAWRNSRLGRGDRNGALRLALYTFLTALLFWLLRVNHTLSTSEFGMLLWGIQIALLISLVVWILYVALEPYMRRLWPQVLISWNRLLSGRWRDPLVGRDLLVGSVAGLIIVSLVATLRVIPPQFGYPSRPPMPGSLDGLTSLREAFASILLNEVSAVVYPMGILLMILLARVVVRRQWVAVATVYLIMNIVSFLENTGPLDRLGSPVVWALILFVLIRFGLLSGIAMFFFANLAFQVPLTLDLSSRHAARSLLLLALLSALVVYAFMISLGGRKLFRDLLAD